MQFNKIICNVRMCMSHDEKEHMTSQECVNYSVEHRFQFT